MRPAGCCFLSPKCVDSDMNGFSYAPSHLLMFTQIAIHFACKKKFPFGWNMLKFVITRSILKASHPDETVHSKTDSLSIFILTNLYTLSFFLYKYALKSSPHRKNLTRLTFPTVCPFFHVSIK